MVACVCRHAANADARASAPSHDDIDLSAGVIRVRRGWDDVAGEIEPKSKAGARTVPIATALREHLVAHALRSGRRDGLVFGRDADRPFNPTSVYGRAATALKKMNAKRTEDELDQVDTLTLHEARHTFASLMIAAGVNAKALSSFMGHSSITVTFDLYGHLMPGNEEQAAGLLDVYLEASAARSA